MLPLRLTPKLVSIFREGYGATQLRGDVLAGLVVGIITLPLAIAFAVASGVKPEQGLYTAIVAGFFIAVFGGSRAQISGPTGAFIVVVAQIVEQHGYDGLATATFLAGLMLIAMGLTGMGIILKFIPYPLVVGFTSGIAVIILTSQIKDFLGLNLETVPNEILARISAIFSVIDTVNLSAFAVGMMTLAILFIYPKFSRRVPGTLVALLFGTAIVQIFSLDVETIGSRFGSVPNSFPPPYLPDFSWGQIRELFSPAMTIALLGGIESLLSATVADGMLRTRHRSDMELVAQGIGNLMSPLFFGIPATGGIARTAANIESGGRSPVASIVHAIFVLLIVLILGDLAALVPMAVLAGILIYVAYNMSEWRAFARIFRYPKSDVFVLVSTFAITILIDLTTAIEVGIVLSIFLFFRRMDSISEVNVLSERIKEYQSDDGGSRSPRPDVPQGIEVFEVFGPLFFSAIDRFKNALARVRATPKVLILLMRHSQIIDGSGIQAIETLMERAKREGAELFLAELHEQPARAIRKARIVPDSNVFKSLEAAVKRAKELIA